MNVDVVEISTLSKKHTFNVIRNIEEKKLEIFENQSLKDGEKFILSRPMLQQTWRAVGIKRVF